MDTKKFKKLVDALPESPNILAKERYYNSAVLVPFIKKDDGLHLLFQKRSANIRQGSEICFPGGMFDKTSDKNYYETAVRETVEELGITPEKIDVKGRLDTLVASIGATVDSFVACLDINDLEELSINADEVEKVFMVPVQEFLDNPPDEYNVRLEVQPSYINKNGEKVTLLPSEELGLPEIYHKPWGGLNHRVLVYKTGFGIIWGITAEIIYEIVNKIQK